MKNWYSKILMFSKVFISFGIVFFTFFSIQTSAQIKFQRTYGIGTYNEGRCVKQTFDGGYIVAGTESEAGNGATDVYLLKVDSLGNFQWHKTFGGTGIDHGYAVEQMSDSGYAVAGYTNSFGNGGYDGYLVRTDKNGDTLWTKTYGTSNWDFTYAMKKTFDGGFVLGGISYSLNNLSEPWIFKTDSFGNVEWNKLINSGKNISINDVNETNDSGFAAIGYKYNYFLDSSDIYIVRLNSLGNTLWQKSFGSIRNERGNAFLVRPDNSFVIAGAICDTLCDNYLLHLAPNGDSMWTSILSPPLDETIYSIDTTHDGKFVITGFTTSFGGGGQDAFITKTDTDGTNIWGYTYGGLEDEIGFSIHTTTDDGFIVAGTSTTYNPGLKSVYLIKTDSTRSTNPIAIGINEPVKTISYFHIYPNPATNTITFQFDDLGFQVSKKNILLIYNQLGKEIFKISIYTKIYQLNLRQFASGIYLCNLFAEGNLVETGKFIVE